MHSTEGLLASSSSLAFAAAAAASLAFALFDFFFFFFFWPVGTVIWSESSGIRDFSSEDGDGEGVRVWDAPSIDVWDSERSNMSGYEGGARVWTGSWTAGSTFSDRLLLCAVVLSFTWRN